MKLALGTVQFGLPYGVANQNGQIAPKEIQHILDTAFAAGVDILDTAIAYGESEHIIGLNGGNRFKIVTKLPAVPNGVDIKKWVYKQVVSSCKRLGVSSLYAVMLHRPEQLFEANGKELFQALQYCRSSGLARKLGISVYQASELELIVHAMDFDLVQLPLSILDRRMLHEGWLTRLKNKGVEIHARSLFLQGLLLMNEQERPLKFSRWSGLWQQWHYWLINHQVTPLQACLAFGIQIDELDRLVIGVDSLSHLTQILKSTNASTLLDCSGAPYSDDPLLINPANWSQL